MGGSSLPSISNDDLEEEEEWVDQGFMGGGEGRLGVKKLGGFLRNLEEERELEGIRDARRVERRLDDQGEEFDEESDEEEEDTVESRRLIMMARMEGVDQGEVKRAFEKKLLELFVDGLDVSALISRLIMIYGLTNCRLYHTMKLISQNLQMETQ